MSYCSKCGAPLLPDAQFCAKCGTPVAAEPPAAAPAEPAVPLIPPAVVPPPASSPAAAAGARTPRHVTMPPREMSGPTPATPLVPVKRSTWWIVPLVIVGIVLLAWLLLAGLPFGRDDKGSNTAPAVDTIAEGTAPPATPGVMGTVIELPGDDPIATQTIAQPPLGDNTDTIAITPPVTATQPPPQQQPRIVEETPPAQTPVPRQTTPAPTPVPRQTTPAPAPRQTTPATREISDAEASNTLRGFVTSRNYYDGVAPNCVEIRSLGYQNVGYTYSVWDACVPGGGSRLLGRWRVDSKTREVFRQRDDGRYLRP